MQFKMELFDSHCHIDFSHFDDDREAVFERMKEHEVTRIVAVAVELEQIPRLEALVAERHNVWFSVGVHPNHEVSCEPDVDTLVRLAGHARCVAIGETGVDMFHNQVAPAIQEARFRSHIQAAQQVKKPVIVHMREADELALKVLAEENVSACGGIMHCFSSDMSAAEQALAMGMFISFSGNVSFKRNDALREVAKQIPTDRLLIETDSPYLAPVPLRGKRNEPAYVRHVAACLAELRGVSLSTLAEQTTANAMACFNVG
ncbi:MAG: TatD family hydrolase [Mariprofundus sp.]|nr:TatD family hydrolase [Mariprofundus sp.]